MYHCTTPNVFPQDMRKKQLHFYIISEDFREFHHCITFEVGGENPEQYEEETE